jgi:hypothetical protein
MVRGGGSRPSAAPRTPARAPRATTEGIYLACLPARNIRPSHSPSTWARPAPPTEVTQWDLYQLIARHTGTFAPSSPWSWASESRTLAMSLARPGPARPQWAIFGEEGRRLRPSRSPRPGPGRPAGASHRWPAAAASPTCARPGATRPPRPKPGPWPTN